MCFIKAGVHLMSGRILTGYSWNFFFLVTLSIHCKTDRWWESRESSTKERCVYEQLILKAINERAPVSKENFFVFQIPFVPVITKDLTFIHLGNDSIVDGLVSHDFFAEIFVLIESSVNT